MKSYTEIIRELREDNDLKQKEVANIIGTTQQHYSRYETGAYEIPVLALVKLSDYYGVSTDYILGRTEYTETNSKLCTLLSENEVLANLLSDFLALPELSQNAVVDYVSLQTFRETYSENTE